MRHGSLFSGIGGFDLAAEWMGWENVFHCEWNTFGQKVLKYYWPKSISYEDITKTDFTIHRGTIDILSGGFPCQPYSTAGKRLGKEDERHLWPEMLRVIDEVKPTWVIGENVRGLVNWNGGMVFNEVQTDLESKGYEVQSFIIPAASVNAPHRRDRVWFVAHTNNKGGCNEFGKIQSENGKISEWYNYAKSCNTNTFNATDSLPIRLQQCENGTEVGGRQREMGREGSEFTNAIKTDGEIRNATDSNGKMLEHWDREGKTIRPTDQEIRTKSFNCSRKWESFPTVSPICFRDDGFSNRLDGITFPKWRNESIKAAGNAIVPQVVHQIFKAIEEYERITTANTD
jgi:DNA (cytosine-5)-methyltransferase 1